MGKFFNENSRVKIPALVHLTRLSYKYVSFKSATEHIDVEPLNLTIPMLTI